jgi:hypothetical protein
MNEALFTLVIPAVVKFLELLNQKDWASAGKIAVAALIGLVAGYFGLYGLNVVDGLVYALSGSGLITVAGYAGKKAAEVVSPDVPTK